MYKINENEMTIKCEESLSFDMDVQPKIDDLKMDIQDSIEENAGYYFDDELQKMKDFLAYELTREDKLNILEKIMTDYDYERNYRGDYNVTLFDEDGIMKAINDWTYEKFKFIY